MGFVTRFLAEQTGTQEFKPGQKAFDIQFRTAKGDQQDVVFIDSGQDLASAIREEVFSRHPEATDYTFRQFNYLDSQERIYIGNLASVASVYVSLHASDN